VRRRTAPEIRQTALDVARRKLDQGCPGCAEAYAGVAARYGATRRQFIKAGVGALASVALAGGLLVATGVEKPKEADAYWCFADDPFCWNHWIYYVIVCCEYFPGLGIACFPSGTAFSGWSC
jgi:hypothetical protein